MFFSLLLQTIAITTPIFLVVMCGYGLRRVGLIDDHFIRMGSRLVFNFTLPVLLFISIATRPLTYGVTLQGALVGVLVTVIMWLLMEALAKRLVQPRSDRGVVVMAGFRSNLGIVGLAYVLNAHGEDGVAQIAMYLALVTVLFNVLSVITLSRKQADNISVLATIKGIAKNPLIIAIMLAAVWSMLGSTIGLQLPQVVLSTGQYFAAMTLPLALLCAGGSLSFKALKDDMDKVWLATLAKLVVAPILTGLVAYGFGLRGVSLELLVLMACAPTAAASYPMVRAMGGNAKLVASIIAVTTLLSFASTAVIISILRTISAS